METIIGTLAWPITTIIVVVLLRKPLSQLLTTLKTLKYKDLELEFEREASRILAEAERDLPEPQIEHSRHSEDSGIRYSLGGDDDPAKDILGAWRKFELFLHELAMSNNIGAANNVRAVVNSLEKQQIIKPEVAEVILNLSALRNRVAHSREEAVNNETSVNFRDALTRVELALKSNSV